MCATCGCSDDAGVRIVDLRNADGHAHSHADGHAHSHGDGHPHTHPGGDTHTHVHPDPGTETLTLETRILAKNDELASRNREWLAARGVRAVNLMSSPGSGKTTLLERTVTALGRTVPICVIEGDQETTFDADRIAAAGAPVLQVNTGSGCHLDATMVAEALHQLDPHDGLVLIENVGNLVCPALFDLGEQARVVIMSVTEGADKPLKYPHIFGAASLVVVNKIDLLPYVDFDLDRFTHDVGLVNRRAHIVTLSATRGDGLDEWLHWLAPLHVRSHTAG
ncbi:MAG TPA: hydrogenase nickel incorporation protein HypB [Jatrophihabitantaceae bacterium]|jgi:hydrogenase nickel incorporation protein HypB|nr:hydrogenase nickel incorporation protein HypB [Jatrophihabitantaceae bacterium]